MRLLSWNINGIRAAGRNGFSEWLNSESADVICLQEVKATQEQAEVAYFPSQYKHIYWNDARKRAGYSGVATFSHQKPEKTIKEFGVEEFDNEGRILIHEFENFILYNIYFPNSQRERARIDYKINFNTCFLEHIEESRKSGKAILACGDFNIAHKEIDLKNPKANINNAGFLPEEREWMDTFVAKGYSDTLRVFRQEGELYTWWTYRLNARERNIGWRIDYFFIDNEHQHLLKDAFILKEIHGSDHCPVGIDIDL
ncbi:MAG: exodeoxyribonuclease III [Calditrichae bacterium]|nr:exodeoxyribonuclease III [Calditrichota bacterium]MCB9058155.1 exodeoxyribonuclease III [Calditrichia bacterium]